jgi:exopolysaccharide biosynthesis polyprenyl glycosylphosphotransferase
MVELYDPHRASDWRETLRGIALAALTGLALYALIYMLSTPRSLPRRGVAAFLISASTLTLIWRLAYIKIFTAPAMLRRVLVVGAGHAGKTLASIYSHMWPPPFFFLGFIDDDPAKRDLEVEGFPVLGNSRQLLEIVEQQDVSDLVVAISGEMQGRTFQTLLDAQERGVEVTRMPTMYEELMGRVPVHHLESDWVLRSFVDQARASGFYELGKRLLDVTGALVGLTFLLLVAPFAALATLLDSGLPIFYVQARLGKGGKVYRILKFRTMVQDAGKDGNSRPAEERDERITRVGRFLRKTHLDEFPQFINVLQGHMSLVGPRAEVPELVSKYQEQVPFYRARLLVKPGITGWAQVNYGYVSTVEDTVIKLEYDLYYIKHRNLMTDLVILLRTVGAVFGLRGR